MELNKFLAIALEKTLEIHYKRDAIGTLKSEIQELQEELFVLFGSVSNKDEIDGSLFFDKKSGQMFVAQIDFDAKVPLTFSIVKPINFSSSQIVDEDDDLESPNVILQQIRERLQFSTNGVTKEEIFSLMGLDENGFGS